MRRFVKPLYAAFLALSLLGVASASAFIQQNQSPPVTLDKISDSLYQISGGRGAAGGLYISETGVLVIDAKMDKASVDQTLAALREITDKPILYLVNTHSDGDHVAGNRFFPGSAVIVAHENCRKDFFRPARDGGPSPWKGPELAPFVPSLTYKEKMVIHLGSQAVELWYFGVGHTAGDTVVYFPEEKAAFIGDQIFAARPQLIHAHKDGNSFSHVKTLSRMLDSLKAETFYSGHSEPLDREAVKKHIDGMKKRQSKIKALIGQGADLETIKKQFAENESRLVETIYNEIMN